MSRRAPVLISVLCLFPSAFCLLPSVSAFILLPSAFSLPPSAFQSPSPGHVDVLDSLHSLPPHIVGTFREPMGFARVPRGPYYVFDRRGHSVHTVDETDGTVRTLVEIGNEEGRLLSPSAFDVAADGSFAVADAPGGRGRVQVFGPAGIRIGGFTRPGRAAVRVALGSLVMNGVGSLVYTGQRVILSEPDSGWLLTEYGLRGDVRRGIGHLRPTGHEHDPELHLTLNTTLALPTPDGGFFVVFLTGPPAFRRYDAEGSLVYERVIQGRELDDLLAVQPKRWPPRVPGSREAPLVPPLVRTAAVDPHGRLWISFVLPYTYVYEPDGEKVRTVQFHAGGVLTPTSLSFSGNDRVLTTPGCYEFVY